MTSDVTIRILDEDDKAEVCQIWVNGLNQSRLVVPRIFCPWFMSTMNAMRDVVLLETGDIGPNGNNLLHTYAGKDDRCMFVTCIGTPQVIVGCCAVKKGMDETKSEPKSQIGSIWRMSVDEKYQGHGIATKLMATCEDWSRKVGCTKMGLYTINPVAANFYVNRIEYRSVDHFHVFKNVIVKLVIPPVHRYEKSIS